MISWVNLLPLFALPFLVVFAPAFFPYTEILSGVVDGEAWRVWFLDRLVLPIFSDSSARDFVHWYKDINIIQQYLLHFLVSINITFAVWPIFFVLGSMIIKSNNYLVLKAIDQKRRSVR